MSPDLTNYWNYKDLQFRFDLFFSGEFSNLDKVRQVYVCVLNENGDKIMLVYNRMGLWLLPGGKLEDGEDTLDTAVREVKEETNCDIKLEALKPFFYQKAYKKVANKWEYQGTEVRYVVPIDKYNDFEQDPDNGDITKAQWVNIEELDKYLDWGEAVVMIKNKLLDR